MKISKYIDHTLLKPDVTEIQIQRLCEDAVKYCFFSVCVNPVWVSLAVDFLKDKKVKVCSTVGFPLGSTTSETKAFEAKEAVKNGADEIDMVINIGKLKSREDEFVFDDIRKVREAILGKVLKVIIETSALKDEEKVRACHLAEKAGADFIKTSTGFGEGGATTKDIKLIGNSISSKVKIKASGGISDYVTAKAMIEAGASRIGCSRSIDVIFGE